MLSSSVPSSFGSKKIKTHKDTIKCKPGTHTHKVKETLKQQSTKQSTTKRDKTKQYLSEIY
jgi:hypothetical protein